LDPPVIEIRRIANATFIKVSASASAPTRAIDANQYYSLPSAKASSPMTMPGAAHAHLGDQALKTIPESC
jgi:hypothetical protein